MVRLKIHLPVDEQTVQFCRRVNTQIRRITDSAIIFSDTSFMIPHITLTMGELAPSQTFEGLTKVTQELAEQVKPLALKLSQPYIDPRSYVVCAIQENLALTALRESMRENIMGAYLISSPSNLVRKSHQQNILKTFIHSGSDFLKHVLHSDVMHLTLAHINAQQEKVNAYLTQVHEMPQAVCAHIEISHIGPKGTCIDRLFVTRNLGDGLLSRTQRPRSNVTNSLDIDI